MNRSRATLVVMLLAVVGVLTLASTAAAHTDGGYLRTSAHWYSDDMVVRATYTVYDNGNCLKDEYGFYDNDACYDYDENNADLDIRVWRWTRSGWRMVHSERMYGFSGAASVTLFYSIDLHVPYYCRSGARWNFKYTVRLFDPVTDGTVAQRSVPFWVGCR